MKINPSIILQKTADYFCISESAELIEPNNHAICYTPRMIAMFLMSDMLGFRDSAIADIFRRNRSTVLRSLREVKSRMKDDKFRMTVEYIKDDLRSI